MAAPFLILAATIGFIVVAIVWGRIPAFFALIFAGMLAGVMVAMARGGGAAAAAAAIGQTTEDFGAAIGKIGLAIALAAVIGEALMASGAADRIVRGLLGAFGPRYAAAALLVSAFLLSAPVFIDTVILLLFPLARALSRRTGGNCVLYLLAVGSGALLANGTIPPAPGPLLMTETLRLNIGVAALTGLAFDLVPGLLSLGIARGFDRWIGAGTGGDVLEGPLEEAAPVEMGFGTAILPVALPMLLIAAASVAGLPGMKARVPAGLAGALRLAGDKNIALALGAAIAAGVLARSRSLGTKETGEVLTRALKTAGTIILLVGAGSAYGKMIERSGLGPATQGFAGAHAVGVVVLAWSLAAVMRVAQGSATVAVITAMGIAASMSHAGGYGVHPLYLYLAIGFGSKFMPWMNDVGFWLFCRAGGLTQGQTVRSWTLFSSVVSVIGLVEVLAASWLWPKPPL